MDLRRLRTFVTVAEHGTVSKAAQVLHITQPALSRQIATFEEELGFDLFQRNGRRLTLTPRAEQLLGECRSVLAHISTLDERAQALRRGDIKVLRIAASAMTIEGVFPSFLGRFAEHFPGARMALIESDAAEHLDMLERGEAHFAISVINAVEVDDNRFGSFLLQRFHILAAGVPSFDLGKSDTIEIRALVNHPLLLPDASYATRYLFDAACRLAGLRPDVFLESASSHTLLAMAEAGHGVAVVPSILWRDRGKMRVARLMHRGELLQPTVAVIWDKRRTLPHYAQGFSKTLADHLHAAFPAARPGRVNERPPRRQLKPAADPAKAPPGPRRRARAAR